MSWNGLLFIMPEGLTIEDLPHDYVPPPIGTAEEVSRKIVAVLPKATYGPTWADYYGDDGYIDFSYHFADDENSAGDKQVVSIGLRMSAWSGPFHLLAQVGKALGLRLYDFGSGLVESWDEFETSRYEDPEPMGTIEATRPENREWSDYSIVQRSETVSTVSVSPRPVKRRRIKVVRRHKGKQE